MPARLAVPGALRRGVGVHGPAELPDEGGHRVMVVGVVVVGCVGGVMFTPES